MIIQIDVIVTGIISLNTPTASIVGPHFSFLCAVFRENDLEKTTSHPFYAIPFDILFFHNPPRGSIDCLNGVISTLKLIDSRLLCDSILTAFN